MSTVDRIDDFQRRHPVVGFPIAVIYKFIDDQGAYLAALITYYGLLSIFPLLLLLTSLLGFLVQDNAQLREDLLEGVLAQLPVLGDELSSPSGLEGNLLAVAVGALVAMYGGLGVAQALQHAMNTVWAVPRHRRPNPFLARAKSAGLLLILAAALVGAAALPQVLPFLTGWLQIIFSTVSAALVFWVLLHFSTHHHAHQWFTLLPGAIVIGIAWRLLEALGGTLVNSVVARSSGSYGVFAVVLGLIAWIFLLSATIVVAAEINVVWARKLFPRALLTVFTDDVDLTRADQEEYAYLVDMQRLKGFQHVEVTFDKEAQEHDQPDEERDGPVERDRAAGEPRDPEPAADEPPVPARRRHRRPSDDAGTEALPTRAPTQPLTQAPSAVEVPRAAPDEGFPRALSTSDHGAEGADADDHVGEPHPEGQHEGRDHHEQVTEPLRRSRLPGLGRGRTR
ncbi:YhjD/YihY/BrkB family envelope integrity protein [Dermacoccaceae bacterium W4C1]